METFVRAQRLNWVLPNLPLPSLPPSLTYPPPPSEEILAFFPPARSCQPNRWPGAQKIPMQRSVNPRAEKNTRGAVTADQPSSTSPEKTVCRHLNGSGPALCAEAYT